MMWAPVVRVIIETLGPLVVDLIGAMVDGDDAAHQRVADIIPSPLRTEVKLAQERARLKRLEDV